MSKEVGKVIAEAIGETALEIKDDILDSLSNEYKRDDNLFFNFSVHYYIFIFATIFFVLCRCDYPPVSLFNYFALYFILIVEFFFIIVLLFTRFKSLSFEPLLSFKLNFIILGVIFLFMTFYSTASGGDNHFDILKIMKSKMQISDFNTRTVIDGVTGAFCMLLLLFQMLYPIIFLPIIKFFLLISRLFTRKK